MHPTIQAYIAAYQTIPFPAVVGKELELSDKEANQVVGQAIEELVRQDTTKGMQLFQRLYDNDRDLFRLFRNLNESEALTKTPEFHEVGDRVQMKVRQLEQILTDKMIKRDTDRTITAFYDHVRLFFPYYDRIGMEE
ncbi:MAG: hypothetical protein Q8O99_07910 [bacterium]|nr:hypothetical protein [bacterium]